MWSEEKQRQMDDLRDREETTLSVAEQQELAQLLAELEQEEWKSLRPGLDLLLDQQKRLQTRLGDLQVQDAVLQVLAERYADLLARSKAQLASLRHERDKLRAEFDRVAGA